MNPHHSHKPSDGAAGLRLQEQGLVKVAYNSNSDTPTAARVGSTFVTEEFGQKYPEITGKIVKAFTRGSEWSSREENREALIALWAKSGTPESLLRGDLDGVDLKLRHSPLLDGFTHELYRQKAAQAREFGLIRRDVGIDDWLEPEYLDAAIRDLGLQGFWTSFDKNGKPEV